MYVKRFVPFMYSTRAFHYLTFDKIHIGTYDIIIKPSFELYLSIILLKTTHNYLYHMKWNQLLIMENIYDLKTYWTNGFMEM